MVILLGHKIRTLGRQYRYVPIKKLKNVEHFKIRLSTRESSLELRDTALPFQDLVAIRTASSCTLSSRAESFLKWGSQMIHP